MKIYLLTCDTAYGEFVKIISAESKEQAFEISGASTYGWDMKDIKELVSTETPSILFDGGGDIG